MAFLRSTCKNGETDTSSLVSQSPQRSFFFSFREQFAFFFFLRLVVCPGAHSQWIERNPFSGCELAFFFSFSSRLVFFVSSRIEKKKKKHRESIAPVRERERKRVGGVLVLCQSWGLSLSLCLCFSFSCGFFFSVSALNSNP